MSFDSLALEESFYYSNISPQLPGFNRGIWRQLETYVREISSTCDSIIVFTGPVYDKEMATIGDNEVSIPGYFYKIIIQFRAKNINTTSYMIPHREGLKDFKEYSVSIDSIESATGLDFLHGLPLKVQDRLERF